MKEYNPRIGAPNVSRVNVYSGAQSRDLPKSYNAAREAFEHADKRRGGARGKLAHNTTIEQVYDRRHTGGLPSYAVVLHGTRVVTFNPDGSIDLNTGGWQTPTTRDRMNRCGIRIGMGGGVASVTHGPNGYDGAGDKEYPAFWSNPEHVYRDGMRLHADGTVTGVPVCGTVAEVRSRRARMLSRAKRAERAGKDLPFAHMPWYWDGKQGGRAHGYHGNCPEAFKTDSDCGLNTRTRKEGVA